MPPGPAPPSPAGPPPPQPPYQQDAQAAAHAAAWAAYYQSQGQATGSAYTPPPAGAAAGQPTAPGASNPYANYGYSAAASAQHSAFIQGQGQPSHAGPSYRPPAPQQPQYTAPNAGQPFNASSGYGYQAPPQYPQQYPRPPQPAQGQGSYNWNAQAQAPPPQQPYRPPPPPPQQQPYTAPAQPSQPYYPPNQPYSPARPSPSPTPGPNRPYQPSPRVPSGPARPPMGGPGTPPHFPPAKRPRFDGPGNPPSGPSGPMNGNMQPNRPPSHAPIRPVGTNMGQPGFPARPLPASLPSAPRAPSASIPSGPSNSGTAYGSGGANAAPVVRPPIHLGLNGPPPPLPFGGSMRGGRPARGGLHGASGGGHVGAGGRNGPVNAPRGPAGMRRSEPARQNRESDRKRKDKDRERAKEKEEKITMTDFRIVGIEVKALGWSWGSTGDAAAAIVDDKTAVTGPGGEKKDAAEEETIEGDGEKPTAGDKATDEQVVAAAESHVDSPKSEYQPSTEAADHGDREGAEDTKEVEDTLVASDSKQESAETSESVEEKRGEKRKAKTPEAEDEGSSPKKRPGEYLSTHRKPNESSDASATVSSVHESNQNRFRIYFESPPELDRVPKASRRNPNKRWRRASSSVAPSVQDGQGKDVSAAAATLEEVGEEKAAEQKEETEEVKEEVTVKEEEEATEDAEVAKTESTLAEDIPKTEPEVDAPTSEHHVESAGDNAAVEEQAPVEPALSQELSASTHVVPQENVKPPADEHAGLDEAADISMVTDAGAVAAAINDLVDAADDAADNDPSRDKPTIVESEQPSPSTDAPKIKLQGIHSLPPKPQLSPVTASQQTATKPAASETKPDDVASTSAASAENTASAYRSRTRRRSSVSSQGSVDEIVPGTDVPTPSTNRVSILYEGSQRRSCIDASVVETVRVHRAEGRIEMVSHPFDKGVEGKDSPKGILVETYDTVDQRFAAAGTDKSEEMRNESKTPSLPPSQLPPSAEPVVSTVYSNKKRPSSEPKWCRNDSADEWLIEQFGLQKASSVAGWKGKSKIVDPDPAPTLQSILDGWASSSTVGQPSDRRAFTQSSQGDPNDLLEILLRSTRGERNPAASASGSGSLGPLATAIRADSPFASHQTHVSLAISAMYRSTTDYAAKAGEKSEVVNEKISDIIKSSPLGMITRSLDGLFKEWNAK